ncbi:hypothetical protein B0H63DRAFT_133458 [Podospora didyma]|uniref:Uncharacterized protein n=1 Tax=Podospora didyma TaxID=330526 RepID=A0AAE0P0M5_9PEZI|nr:hypothetical protein B0H63DRAFT_133458 [Podospora didyma]
MECQTCSKVLQSANALHEHIGFFQSQIQYHMRELLKCLAHASLQSSDSGGDIDIDNGRDSSSDNDLEEEGDDENEEDEDGGDDLRCPQQGCKQKEEFVIEKELNRHFATHIPCYEFCQPCNRVFHRASTYLHHKCKKGKSGQKGQRILSEDVQRRRKALRAKVERELRTARGSKRPHGSVVNQNHRHKRRRTEADDIALDPVKNPNDRTGSCGLTLGLRHRDVLR